MTDDYRELRRTIADLGLLDSQPGYYTAKAAVALLTLAAAVAIVIARPSPVWLLLDAVFMGFAFTQIALLSHDIAHRQAFRGRRSNRLGRLVFGSLLLGASYSWWTDKHNQHHASPNHVDKDPDVQFAFLAFDPSQISSRRRWLHPVIAVQAFVFVLVLPLQALNMRVASIRYLVSEQPRDRLAQAALIVVHFALTALLLVYIGDFWLALAFFAIHQGTFGLYNSSVFASNHKGMTMIDEGTRLDFLREQVLTSRNVLGPRFLDFWYGGLNFQIEHHLFPTMPRNRLREAQVVIEAFCRRKGIPYYATGLVASYREGLTHLHRTGESLR